MILDEFPGFDARREAPNGALDVWNVDRDSPANLRTRWGSVALRTAASGYTLLHAHSSSQLLAKRGSTLEAIDTSAGTVVASTATATQTRPMATMTTPSSTLSFYYDGTAGSLKQWNGSAFSTPAFTDHTPDGQLMAVWMPQNRLVVNDQTNPHRIYFSNPDAPETFGALDYVDIPGLLTGMVAWREMVFVFTDSGFFVFYSVSTDSTGGAIFNFRPVTFPGSIPTDGGVVAAHDAVYFVALDGIYRTTGGSAEKVSGPLDPLFGVGGTASTVPINDPSLTTAPKRPAVFGDRIFFPLQETTTSRYLAVFNTRDGSWFVYSTPAYMLATAVYAGGTYDVGQRAYFVDGTTDLSFFESSVTTDDGTAIVSRYQTRFIPLADGEQISVRGFDVYGTGSVTLSLAADGGSLNTGGDGNGKVSPPLTVALTSGDMSWFSSDALARQLSIRLSATSGAWTVDRVIAQLDGKRDWT